MQESTSDTRIEAILFFKGEPVSVDELSTLAGISPEETAQALTELGARLSGGIRLMRQDDTVMLATAPEHADTIERLIKEDISKDLGKAGAETLATVLYMGPITRAGVDHVRGVNSSFILRNLAARGLVEKVSNPSDSRSVLYRPTLALLAHLGVASAEDLPEYGVIRGDIQSFQEQSSALPVDADEMYITEDLTDSYASSDANDIHD
ncbi:MAG: SMC-Scp complex subunit ScpB [Candidatus Yonathbacteria bacterium]|nr:SMC-Scp complex subunit ScpB [Candidatus Yonathbacteria bacterium]